MVRYMLATFVVGIALSTAFACTSEAEVRAKNARDIQALAAKLAEANKDPNMAQYTQEWRMIRAEDLERAEVEGAGEVMP